MQAHRSAKYLSKFLDYVLGNSPHEFGLVPSESGFFKIKDLMKAIWEEDGFRYVRESHLNEILLTVSDPPFEIHGKLIRSLQWKSLPGIRPDQNPPKLLYTCVRKKAHAFSLEKGIFPVGHERVVLSSKPDMAARIGKRFDGDPVMMTVQTVTSMENGVVFYSAGSGLYLADSIPAGSFTGPPAPKEKPFKQKSKNLKEQEEPEIKKPGSYFVDISSKKERKKKEYRKRDKDISWKKERRRRRRTDEKW
jgi:putative RNA 2'-phosphotransferase